MAAVPASYGAINTFEGVLIDLEGVVYVGDAALPGSLEAIERLRAAGRAGACGGVSLFQTQQWTNRANIRLNRAAAHALHRHRPCLLPPGQVKV